MGIASQHDQKTSDDDHDLFNIIRSAAQRWYCTLYGLQEQVVAKNVVVITSGADYTLII